MIRSHGRRLRVSKGKVHKFEEEPGLQDTALCGQLTRRGLLPLHLSDNWHEVTCSKCLKHRPALTLRDRLAAMWRCIRG